MISNRILPIDDDIIIQHLNIIVCNCNICFVHKKICHSRLRNIILAIENQIENITDINVVEWKKEILEIIKKNECDSDNNLFIQMQLLSEKCLYFLASEKEMTNGKFINFINEYSNKFSKHTILLSLYAENTKINKYNIVFNNLFVDNENIEFNWYKIDENKAPYINTFYIPK